MSRLARNSILQSSFNCATALILFAGIASAQTTTEDFTFNSSFQSLSSIGSLSLPAFDPSLGTLENIQLTVALTGTARQTLVNSVGRITGVNSITYGLPGSISGPGNFILNATVPTHVSSPSSPGVTTLSELPTPVATVTDLTDPTNLDLWQGAGNNVNLSYAVESPNIDIPTSILSPPSFQGKAHVTVTYTYDSGILAAPEPPGKYLSAIAAAGVMFLWLRRRSRPTSDDDVAAV